MKDKFLRKKHRIPGAGILKKISMFHKSKDKVLEVSKTLSKIMLGRRDQYLYLENIFRNVILNFSSVCSCLWVLKAECVVWAMAREAYPVSVQ